MAFPFCFTQTKNKHFQTKRHIVFRVEDLRPTPGQNTDWEIGLVVKDFLVVELLNNQAQKSNNQKIWLLRLALVFVLCWLCRQISPPFVGFVGKSVHPKLALSANQSTLSWLCWQISPP